MADPPLTSDWSWPDCFDDDLLAFYEPHANARAAMERRMSRPRPDLRPGQARAQACAALAELHPTDWARLHGEARKGVGLPNERERP